MATAVTSTEFEATAGDGVTVDAGASSALSFTTASPTDADAVDADADTVPLCGMSLFPVVTIGCFQQV